jgi:hypothetical protein
MSETQAKPMTIEEARAFIARVPWRQVQDRPYAYRDGKLVPDPSGKPPDPHQYVILEWREVPSHDFDCFRALIKQHGYRATYRAPYRPDYEMRNWYIEIDGWCYWWIDPNMLNRERAEVRKHVPIPD